MKRILALLLTAAVLVSFYGCRGGREDFSGDESSTVSGPKSEEQAALDEIRKSELTCPGKTVALTEEAAKLWLLAGGKLYAVCDCENVISGLEGDEKKIGKNGVIRAEEVVQLAPDYVLLDDSLPNAEELKEALSKAGIRCEDTTIISFDDYFSAFKNFCMMTKNTEAYEKGALNVRGRRTAIMRKAANEMQDLMLSLGMERMESGSASADSGKGSGTAGSGNVSFELIRVTADGAAVASKNDWVCSMLEDLGLVNLCTGEEPVTVTWKKAGKNKTASSAAAETSSASASSGTAESGKAESGAAESGAAESSGTAQDISGDMESSGTEGSISDAENTESGMEKNGTESAFSEDESTAGKIPDAGTETGEGGEQAANESRASAAADSKAESTASATGAAAKTEEASAAKDREAFEKEIRKNPDFIFVVYCENEKQGRKELEALTGSMKGWNSVKAVKYNHMLTLPKESFCTLPNDAWDLPMEYLYQSIFLMG